MSAQEPSSFVEWWRNLPIPWLVGGDVGSDEATANGESIDAQVSLIKQAIKARMPGLSPDDAVLHIGADRQLEPGPDETLESFRIRCLTAWDDWARAGTALELLVQLHFVGFPEAIIVQQSGLAYQLSAPPAPGEDPTALLVIDELGSNELLDGAPPWWSFDLNNQLCSRFAILFPPGVASFAPEDRARLRRVISRWRPRKATAVEVVAFSLGKTVGWPIRNVNDGDTVGPSIAEFIEVM